MERFDADRASVLERAKSAGVERILVPSLELGSARRILGLVQENSSLYAAIGFHPTELGSFQLSTLEELKALAQANRVVAVGEIGLDYYWVADAKRREEQRAALRAQLSLALTLGLPVVLHMREAGDADHGECGRDMMGILSDWVRELSVGRSPLMGRCGVLHSFAGTLEVALQAIDLGFYVGVTGPITYPRAEARRELVRRLPIDRLLIETDAPFLSPQSHRGHRNEPAYVADIADKIAQVQSRTTEEAASALSGNAARLFAWGEPD